jgi:nucleotidyltransferase/DNA polymerase involved in DNA repair
MSRYKYFDELSGGDSSDGCCSTSDNDVDEDDDMFVANVVKTKDGHDNNNNNNNHAMIPSETNNDNDIDNDNLNNYDNQNSRIILHADVDCFYCQCEVLDRQLDPMRPIAIGQKHIVVTCNYAARECGVTKLMDRTLAQQICTSLLIIDGSDLQRYRIHGRKIYESFRRIIKSIDSNSAVRKGCMDEMSADISTISPSLDSIKNHAIIQPEDVFNYNDPSSKEKSVILLTEDQTGAQTMVHRDYSTLEHMTKHENVAINSAFNEKLQESISCAIKVRQTILNETGFTTTMGISYNPMMAKIASGLRKPGIINVLQPCYSSQLLVESMPLRKIPTIGSRTMKVLLPSLEQQHGCKGNDDTTKPWICRYDQYSCHHTLFLSAENKKNYLTLFFVPSFFIIHQSYLSDLLQVPRNEIMRCLNNVRSGGKSRYDRIELFVYKLIMRLLRILIQ